MQKIFLTIIYLYQFFLSPWLGKNCRFDLSCSDYAKEAIIIHGSVKGLWLTLKRLSKCHPFYDGDEDDPVPIGEEKLAKLSKMQSGSKASKLNNFSGPDEKNNP